MKSQGLYTDNPIVGEIEIFRQSSLSVLQLEVEVWADGWIWLGRLWPPALIVCGSRSPLNEVADVILPTRCEVSIEA